MTLLRAYPVRMRVRNRNRWDESENEQWQNRDDKNENYESRTFSPAVDIIESEGQFIVTAELPGLTDSDINLSVKDDTLTIIGHKKPAGESRKALAYGERKYGRFERVVQLNDMVDSDNISAYFQNGVLEVVLPKTEKTQEKNIPVHFKN